MPASHRRPRRVVLLGATGSIGRQACDIIARFPEHFQLVGAVVGSDVAGLAQVVEQFSVSRSAVVRSSGTGLPAGCSVGVEAACEIAALEADVVCVGIGGAAALRPTLAALDAGTDIAIASKEVLVMAGALIRDRAVASGAALLPVDSEHSALWQCLRGEDLRSVERLILTGSGGPFRDRARESFVDITIAEALRHPNWSMGPKITIDSATMMNKGLEIIEAHFLFDVPYERIDVMIQPSSLVHSAVEFCDGAIMAQVGIPDMRIPIALALAAGRRLAGVCSPVELADVGTLEFRSVDGTRFPAIRLAREAGMAGGGAPCVLSAANEAAVAAFLDGRCRFVDIVPLVAAALEAAEVVARPSLDEVVALDAWARARVQGFLDGPSRWKGSWTGSLSLPAQNLGAAASSPGSWGEA